MQANQNIFLVGMPGAGKSTVGKALARQLDMPFLDTDEELVARNGVAIATIFEIEGESGFRHRESAVIAELAEKTGVILATGGGAILSEANRAIMSSSGIVVYLRANIDVLVQRTTRDIGKRKKRPLLEGGNVRERLANLLAIREPLYNEIAHITIDSNHTNRAKFLQMLIGNINQYREKTNLEASPIQRFTSTPDADA